jgi:hypothetical protein
MAQSLMQNLKCPNKKYLEYVTGYLEDNVFCPYAYAHSSTTVKPRLAYVHISQNVTSYLTENTVCFRNVNQPVNVDGNNRYLLRKLTKRK